MVSARVNPNISYAFVASKNLCLKNSQPLPTIFPVKNYSFLSPYQQCFPLPYDVMKYILQNPKSPDQLLKLYQTCKYFYFKKQVLIVAGVFTADHKLLGQKFYGKNRSSFKNIKKPHFWFIDGLVIHKMYFFNFTKIYRSSLKILLIDGVIALKEFELLVAEKTVESFYFYPHGRIKNLKNEEVSIHQIIQLLPNIKKLWYFNENEVYSKEILQKMNAIKMGNKFEEFYLLFDKTAEDFDANLVFEFIQKRADSLCKINLIPWGENKENILMELKAAQEKIKSKKEWENKKFALSYFNFVA